MSHWFEIDLAWHNVANVRQPISVAWMTESHAEMYEWLQESGVTYRLETKLVEYEYDSNYVLYRLYVVYESEDDAVHHRMRW